MSDAKVSPNPSQEQLTQTPTHINSLRDSLETSELLSTAGISREASSVMSTRLFVRVE